MYKQTPLNELSREEIRDALNRETKKEKELGRCRQCKQTFVKTRKDKTFCSNRCKGEYWYFTYESQAKGLEAKSDRLERENEQLLKENAELKLALTKLKG
jgi:hypothetical protein